MLCWAFCWLPGVAPQPVGGAPRPSENAVDPPPTSSTQLAARSGTQPQCSCGSFWTGLTWASALCSPSMIRPQALRPDGVGRGHSSPPHAGAGEGEVLYGHSWVVLSRIVCHADFGVIGLPLLGFVDVRKKDVPPLPAAGRSRSRPNARAPRGWSRGSAYNCHRNRSHPGWPGTASPRNGSSSNQRSRPVSWWRAAARTRRCPTCRR